MHKSSRGDLLFQQSMESNFSLRRRFILWRELWLVLALEQKRLGIPITRQQIEEMEKNIEVNVPNARDIPRLSKKEISLHLKEYRLLCPKAAPIMNLGASANFISDNAELIMCWNGFNILLSKLANCIRALSIFADKYKSMPTLSYTHFQLSRLTTAGRRACVWISDLLSDFHSMKFCCDNLKFLGVKGINGNQDVLFSLFKRDHSKVKTMEKNLAKIFGFRKLYNICGESYSRKINLDIMLCFSKLGVSIHKVCNDIKLLCKIKEMELHNYELQKMQQKVCISARHLIMFFSNSLKISAEQWLEQTDDCVGKSSCIAEAFIKSDEILSILPHILENLKMCPSLINRRVQKLIPSVEYELLLLEMVKRGADIKECQERFRKIENDVGHAVREGKDADFMTGIKSDDFFMPIHDDLKEIMNPNILIGRSEQQVMEFLEDVKPVLEYSQSPVYSDN